MLRVRQSLHPAVDDNLDPVINDEVFAREEQLCFRDLVGFRQIDASYLQP